jgi:hypothetical protein
MMERSVEMVDISLIPCADSKPFGMSLCSISLFRIEVRLLFCFRGRTSPLCAKRWPHLSWERRRCMAFCGGTSMDANRKSYSLRSSKRARAEPTYLHLKEVATPAAPLMADRNFASIGL